MRTLEHGVASLRTAWRRLAARRGGRTPARLAPARLVLRLDEGDLPGSLGGPAALPPVAWQRALVSAVDWLGPVPVTVLAHRSAGQSTTAELVRFAHRLECSTELVTDGQGIDLPKARELVDRGLQRLRVLVGGVSPEVHHAVVGGPLDAAVAAVAAAVDARADRRAPLDIEVAVPWIDPVQTELTAIVGWARQAGAQGLRIQAPWHARAVPADPEALDAVLASGDPFHRTTATEIAALHAAAAHQDGGPGLARQHAPGRQRHAPCPVGGLRLELTAGGRLCCCPFKAPLATGLAANPDEALDLRALWLQGAAHLAEIRSCDRACIHPELAPA